MKKKILFIILLVVIIFSIVFFINKKSTAITSENIDTNVDIDNSDESIDWSNYQTKDITLSETITITDPGIYNLSGTINNGLIIVDTNDNVKLNLNNVKINNSTGPAIYIKNSNTTIISTNDNSINTLTDGQTYENYEDEIEGVIYSTDDLVLEGTGKLIINANKGDGIVSKDDLKFNTGTYEITSEDDGIRGKDSVYIKDGNFTINSSGDGIKSTNDSESDKGYVKILSGTFNITSTFDGIQAETKLLIDNGTYNIKTGNGSSNSSEKEEWGTWKNKTTTDNSAKGLKAENNIVIKDGQFNLDTSDDSIHTNNYISISNATLKISSGDDGIHADEDLIIESGEINITKSYEGLEANNITINNGNIDIISSDDGLNAAGGNDSSGENRPGADPRNNTNSNSKITINNGNIYINSTGDGIDSNGSIYINNGITYVDGPTNDGNGALDYDKELLITGGTLLTLGSSGMAQGISETSTQCGLLINLSNNYQKDSIITIIDSEQNEIISYTANKSFQSIAFSSNKLVKDNTYTLKINNKEIKTFTINSISTTIGSSSRNKMPNK